MCILCIILCSNIIYDMTYIIIISRSVHIKMESVHQKDKHSLLCHCIKTVFSNESA